MKWTTTTANDKITELDEALDLIEKELKWILSESTAQKIQPKTALADEFWQKFMQLYVDFLKVKERVSAFAADMSLAEFSDRALGTAYRTTAAQLLKKTEVGCFKQFASVAETGKLPIDEI